MAVEAALAPGAGWQLFLESCSPRELVGGALLLAGVALLAV